MNLPRKAKGGQNFVMGNPFSGKKFSFFKDKIDKIQTFLKFNFSANTNTISISSTFCCKLWLANLLINLINARNVTQLISSRVSITASCVIITLYAHTHQRCTIIPFLSQTFHTTYNRVPRGAEDKFTHITRAKVHT